MKAQTIEQFIKEKGITPSQLAKACGVSKQQVTQFQSSNYIVIDGGRFYSSRKHEIDQDLLAQLMKENAAKAES